MSTEDIYNYRKVDDRVITGGQPTAEQLQSAAQEGFSTVINLLPFIPTRSLPDEEQLVQSLGMDYHYLPVDWANPTEQDFAAFEQLLKQTADEKVLIHCGANFRVTALYSLYAMKYLGWTAEGAEAFRASIWAGNDYPAWEVFIREMHAKILG